MCHFFCILVIKQQTSLIIIAIRFFSLTNHRCREICYCQGFIWLSFPFYAVTPPSKMAVAEARKDGTTHSFIHFNDVEKNLTNIQQISERPLVVGDGKWRARIMGDSIRFCSFVSTTSTLTERTWQSENFA